LAFLIFYDQRSLPCGRRRGFRLWQWFGFRGNNGSGT